MKKSNSITLLAVIILMIIIQPKSRGQNKRIIQLEKAKLLLNSNIQTEDGSPSTTSMNFHINGDSVFYQVLTPANRHVSSVFLIQETFPKKGFKGVRLLVPNGIEGEISAECNPRDESTILCYGIVIKNSVGIGEYVQPFKGKFVFEVEYQKHTYRHVVILSDWI